MKKFLVDYQEQLLRENDLNVEKAIEIVRAAEASREQIQNMKYDTATINFVKENQNKTKTQYNCKKCGQKHKPRECPAFWKICAECKKKNHFATKCFQNTKNIHEMNVPENELVYIDSVNKNETKCAMKNITDSNFKNVEMIREQENIFSCRFERWFLWHVPLDEVSSEICTVNTPFGRYKFNKKAFGIFSAPEACQKRNQKFFGDIEGVEIYFDDIIVAGWDEDSHDAIMSRVLERAKLLNIKFNPDKLQYRVVMYLPLEVHPSKYQRELEVSYIYPILFASLHISFLGFGWKRVAINSGPKNPKDLLKKRRVRRHRVSDVKYVGQTISKSGIKPDKDHIKAIVEMPTPKSKTEVTRVLGLMIFLSKFIPNVSKVTALLRKIIHKNVEFNWGKEQELSFVNIKELLAKAPILKVFSVDDEIVIQCDSSKDGLGSCLIQKGQPVSFVSRSLINSEKNYAQIEKELLAIVFSFEKYHNFVYAHKVVVQSDHKPLMANVKKPMHKISSRMQRMILKLLKYDFEINYVPGNQMFLADTLSRAFPVSETVRDDPEILNIVHIISKHLPMSEKRRVQFKKRN
ncbi:retrovirus-related Pol polyprotein from transposon 297 [Trichonephila clavipes]|nr:retrovirus-related Pol polyprotein from transposon 297 [Trichonephila clavipes]